MHIVRIYVHNPLQTNSHPIFLSRGHFRSVKTATHVTKHVTKHVKNAKKYQVMQIKEKSR